LIQPASIRLSLWHTRQHSWRTHARVLAGHGGNWPATCHAAAALAITPCFPGYDSHRPHAHQRQAVTNCISYSRNYSSRIIGVKQMKHFSAQAEKQLKYESIINP
jgi:hypothetical protein